jgi:hypothetical protein
MQTFIPYADFRRSAEVLDYRRLGKQRVESYQLLKAMNPAPGETKRGWSRHPACVMWKDYQDALVLYSVIVCDVWIERGYKDTCRDKILAFSSTPGVLPVNPQMPPWWGREDIHASHRANLIRKDPERYRAFGWTEEPMETYIWPV